MNRASAKERNKNGCLYEIVGCKCVKRSQRSDALMRLNFQRNVVLSDVRRISDVDRVDVGHFYVGVRVEDFQNHPLRADLGMCGIFEFSKKFSKFANKSSWD